MGGRSPRPDLGLVASLRHQLSPLRAVRLRCGAEQLEDRDVRDLMAENLRQLAASTLLQI